jgi:predicted aspartyl protease
LQRAFIALQDILRLEYTNIEAIKLSAEIHRREGNFMLALESIYSARRAASGSEQEKSLIKESRQWVAELATQLNFAHDEIGTLNLYQKALELEPDYARHYLNLAKSYLALGNKDDAWNTLELARFDSSLSVEIDNMENSIKNEKPLDFSSATAIPLSRHGKQFYVAIVINNAYQANWLLDTGASMSVISPDALSNISVDPGTYAESWFNTANGVVKGHTVQLNNVTVGNSLAVSSLKVGVLPLAADGRFDGLLGMDFLRLYDFYLDQQANVLYLKE